MIAKVNNGSNHDHIKINTKTTQDLSIACGHPRALTYNYAEVILVGNGVGGGGSFVHFSMLLGPCMATASSYLKWQGQVSLYYVQSYTMYFILRCTS